MNEKKQLKDVNSKEINVGNRIAYMTNGCWTLSLGSIVKIVDDNIYILGDGNSRLGSTTYEDRIVVLERTTTKNTELEEDCPILNAIVPTGVYDKDDEGHLVARTQRSVDFVHADDHELFKSYFLYGFNKDQMLQHIAKYIEEREILEAIRKLHSFTIIGSDPKKSAHDPRLDQNEMAYMLIVNYS
ncbi:MAG: hypothetical protein QM489_01180 [Candidatus Izemoplasma sp.]